MDGSGDEKLLQYGDGIDPDLDAEEHHHQHPRKLRLLETERVPLFSHPTHAVLEDVDTGRKFIWSSREHRKMRHPQEINAGLDASTTELPGSHPKSFRHRFNLICWEPHIVTWHICWVNMLANTLWVINGVYATWPVGSNADPILYWTGMVGAFLFIVTGYLGVVEAINQTHAEVSIPTENGEARGREPRRFRGFHQHYGKPRSALGTKTTGVSKVSTQHRVLDNGYPMLVTPEGWIVTGESELVHLLPGSGGTSEEEENSTMSIMLNDSTIGREAYVVLGHKAVRVKILEVDDLAASSCPDKCPTVTAIAKWRKEEDERKERRPYIWWTWHPAWDHIAIFNAYAFFISTIIFFIPAFLWLPMANNGRATVGQTLFFVDILQIIPSIGFCYVGHAAMAEAAGSWWKPNFSSIGYNLSVFNTIGGYGFLFCAIFAIPSTINPLSSSPELYKWGSAFSTFWASCAFWIAGTLQCIEFSSQHPLILDGRRRYVHHWPRGGEHIE